MTSQYLICHQCNQPIVGQLVSANTALDKLPVHPDNRDCAKK